MAYRSLMMPVASDSDVELGQARGPKFAILGFHVETQLLMVVKEVELTF